MHDEGSGGLTVDHAEAARLYALAAAQGSRHAQYNLACSCYRYGEGVPRNLAEAARLLRLSAAQGDTEAGERLKEVEKEAAAEAAQAAAVAAAYD